MSQIPDLDAWAEACAAVPVPEPVPAMPPARPRRALPRRPGGAPARRARG